SILIFLGIFKSLAFLYPAAITALNAGRILGHFSKGQHPQYKTTSLSFEIFFKYVCSFSMFLESLPAPELYDFLIIAYGPMFTTIVLFIIICTYLFSIVLVLL